MRTLLLLLTAVSLSSCQASVQKWQARADKAQADYQAATGISLAQSLDIAGQILTSYEAARAANANASAKAVQNIRPQ